MTLNDCSISLGRAITKLCLEAAEMSEVGRELGRLLCRCDGGGPGQEWRSTEVIPLYGCVLFCWVLGRFLSRESFRKSRQKA